MRKNKKKKAGAGKAPRKRAIKDLPAQTLGAAPAKAVKGGLMEEEGIFYYTPVPKPTK